MIDEKKTLKELHKIQKLCSKYYDNNVDKYTITQDIWRIINFLTIDIEK